MKNKNKKSNQNNSLLFADIKMQSDKEYEIMIRKMKQRKYNLIMLNKGCE